MIRKLATNNTDNVSGGKIYKISDNEWQIEVEPGIVLQNCKCAAGFYMPKNEKGDISITTDNLEVALKAERFLAGKKANTKEYFDRHTMKIMPISKTSRFKNHF